MRVVLSPLYWLTGDSGGRTFAMPPGMARRRRGDFYRVMANTKLRWFIE